MKFALSAITSKNDGMFLHHSGIAASLRQLGSVTIIPDDVIVSVGELENYDRVFRYGWSAQSQGYNDANFNLNISSHREKNVLIAPFNMQMLHADALAQAEQCFSRIIYDSSFSKEHGDSILKNARTAYVHPVLTPDIYGCQTHNLKDSLNTFNFLHISNGLYWIKGVDLIVRSFLRAFSTKDAALLTLVLKDRDDYFLSLDHLFIMYGRRHQLRLLQNNLDHAELGAVYAASDCYVCASRYDTFSLPTLEAAALGLMIIAHDKGGMRDYLGYIESSQRITIETQPVVIPENVWRGNQSVRAFEPELKSLVNGLRTAYGRAKRNKHHYVPLQARFGNPEYALRTMAEIAL